jgi:hypothetical protein
MPLLDHFQPPLSVHHPWMSVHSAWANAMVKQLNEGLLPDRFYALPNVQPGGRLEVDVATIDRDTTLAESSAVATAIWAPPRPALVVSLPDAELDIFEVQILDGEEGRLVAAVELVSPANKDRPASRRALAVKCAALLQQGVSVSLVDVVTRRTGNWHDELISVFQGTGLPATLQAGLVAAAYRLHRSGAESAIECWTDQVAVGSELPTLPMWLGADVAVPLDLEQSYAAMCVSLRLHDS